MARQYLLPEVGFLNETGNRQYIVPGAFFEQESSDVSVTVSPSVLNLTATLNAPTVGVISDITVSPSVLNIDCAAVSPVLDNVPNVAKQYLVPEIGYINETGNNTFLVPSNGYLNEVYRAVTHVTVQPFVLDLASALVSSTVSVPRIVKQYLVPGDVGMVDESAAREYLVPGTSYIIDGAPLDKTITVQSLNITFTVIGVTFPLPTPRIVIRDLISNYRKSSGIEKSFVLKGAIGTDET